MKLNTPDLKGSRIIVCDTLVPLKSQSRKSLSSNTTHINVIKVQQKLIFQFREVGNGVNLPGTIYLPNSKKEGYNPLVSSQG